MSNQVGDFARRAGEAGFDPFGTLEGIGDLVYAAGGALGAGRRGVTAAEQGAQRAQDRFDRETHPDFNKTSPRRPTLAEYYRSLREAAQANQAATQGSGFSQVFGGIANLFGMTAGDRESAYERIQRQMQEEIARRAAEDAQTSVDGVFTGPDGSVTRAGGGALGSGQPIDLSGQDFTAPAPPSPNPTGAMEAFAGQDDGGGTAPAGFGQTPGGGFSGSLSELGGAMAGQRGFGQVPGGGFSGSLSELGGAMAEQRDPGRGAFSGEVNPGFSGSLSELAQSMREGSRPPGELDRQLASAGARQAEIAAGGPAGRTGQSGLQGNNPVPTANGSFPGGNITVSAADGGGGGRSGPVAFENIQGSGGNRAQPTSRGSTAAFNQASGGNNSNRQGQGDLETGPFGSGGLAGSGRARQVRVRDEHGEFVLDGNGDPVTQQVGSNALGGNSGIMENSQINFAAVDSFNRATPQQQQFLQQMGLAPVSNGVSISSSGGGGSGQTFGRSQGGGQTLGGGSDRQPFGPGPGNSGARGGQPSFQGGGGNPFAGQQPQGQVQQNPFNGVQNPFAGGGDGGLGAGIGFGQGGQSDLTRNSLIGRGNQAAAAAGAQIRQRGLAGGSDAAQTERRVLESQQVHEQARRDSIANNDIAQQQVGIQQQGLQAQLAQAFAQSGGFF